MHGSNCNLSYLFSREEFNRTKQFISINSRSQRGEQAGNVSGREIQTRNFEPIKNVHATKVLGNQDRPKISILPYPSKERGPEILRVPIQGKDILFSSNAIWTNNSPFFIHKSDQRNYQMATDSQYPLCLLHRRYFCNLIFPTASNKGHVFCAEMAHQLRVVLVARKDKANRNKACVSSWLVYKPFNGYVIIIGRKEDENKATHWGYVKANVGQSKNCGQAIRADQLYRNAASACKDLYAQVLSCLDSSCQAIWMVKRIDQNDKTTQERTATMLESSLLLRGIALPIIRDTKLCTNYRCIWRQMGRSIIGCTFQCYKSDNWSIQFGGSKESYQLERINSSLLFFDKIWSSRLFHSSLDGFNGCKKLFSQEVWQKGSLNKDCSENVNLDGKEEDNNQQSMLHRIQEKLGRPMVQNESCRKDDSTKSQQVSTKIGTKSRLGFVRKSSFRVEPFAYYMGSFRNSRQSYSSIISIQSKQQMGDSFRHFYSVDKQRRRSNLLWLSPFGISSPVSTPSNSVQVKDYSCCSAMGICNVLASNTSSDKESSKRQYSSHRIKGGAEYRDKEEPALEGNMQRAGWHTLSSIRRDIVTRSYAVSTQKLYKSLWTRFKWFCRGKAEMSTVKILDFCTFLFNAGKGYQIQAAYAAILHYAILLDLPLNNIDQFRVRKVLEAMTLVYNREQKQSRKRDGFPVEILQLFFTRCNTNSFHDLRIILLVMVALRALLRPIEIQRLQVRNVIFKDELLYLNIKRAKTGRKNDVSERPIPIERAAGSLCIVNLLPKYLEKLKEWYQDNGKRFHRRLPLFPFLYPKKGVQAMERRIMDKLLQDMKNKVIQACPEFKNRFQHIIMKPHSWRIGGTGKLSGAGAPFEAIRAVGNWNSNSEAVHRYVRTQSAVYNRFSSKLFD